VRPSFNVQWARENLKGFRDLEIAKLKNDREKKRLDRKFAGCVKVVPKDERKAA
jgi:hypothetical protein